MIARITFPLKFIMDQRKKIQAEMKQRLLANTYGTAFPLKMDFDAQVLSRYGFELPLS